MICNDKATLAYVNNLGCIELNPWHSNINFPEKPDYIVIDIDPSEKNNFDQVIKTANAFKKVLDKAGVKNFCKTSGSAGLHVYVPMKKKYDYEEVKSFAHLLCMMVNDTIPDFTTLEGDLKKRGNKKNIWIICKTEAVKPYHLFILYGQKMVQRYLCNCTGKK